jgi:hypothetical protein
MSELANTHPKLAMANRHPKLAMANRHPKLAMVTKDREVEVGRVPEVGQSPIMANTAKITMGAIPGVLWERPIEMQREYHSISPASLALAAKPGKSDMVRRVKKGKSEQTMIIEEMVMMGATMSQALRVPLGRESQEVRRMLMGVTPTQGPRVPLGRRADTLAKIIRRLINRDANQDVRRVVIGVTPSLSPRVPLSRRAKTLAKIGIRLSNRRENPNFRRVVMRVTPSRAPKVPPGNRGAGKYRTTTVTMPTTIMTTCQCERKRKPNTSPQRLPNM